jgi:hypothetical protein
MLVYVDESYKSATEPNCKSTFAAVCIPQVQYRAFDTDFFKLKRHFWKNVQEPSDLEFKGRNLLSEHALELPKNRDFIRQLIILMKEYQLVPFAVVQDGSLQLSAIMPPQLPQLYRAVLGRIDRLMIERAPNDQAILFFDGIDHQTNQKIAIAFNSYMFRHYRGVQLFHVLPVPNFSDSVVTPGIQIADVLAYCVNERYARYGHQGDHLENFFLEFRNLSFNYENPDENVMMWGFTQIGHGQNQAEPIELEEGELEAEPTSK